MPPSIHLVQSAESSRPNSPHGIRKRVCKACDRCRLKKGKCDGANQCSRCKADNAICVFGERKRPQEKNYPKGYAEMLEQQQAQLVSALTEIYYQLRKASAWEGPSLDESGGPPSTHDILSALNLLEIDSQINEASAFEELCDKREFKMTLDHASIARRRLHTKSNSKAADSYPKRSDATVSDDRKSLQSEASSPRGSFDRPSVASPLGAQSTIPRWEASLQQPNAQAPSAQHSTFKGYPVFANDKGPYVSEWEHALVKMNETYQAYRDEPKAFGVSSNLWESASVHLDLYPDLLPSENGFGMPDTNDLFDLNWIKYDSSDFVWQPAMTAWAT